MAGSSKAYVIGGSIAGLLTASVLARHFDRVVIVERDDLPDLALPHRGVPQSRQLHMLMTRALIVLDELLPGFPAALTAAGAAVGDLMADVQRFADGALLPRDPIGLVTMSVTRPFLELWIRRRVAELPGVEFRTDLVADGLVAANGRVTGLTTIPARGGVLERHTGADLVVDASGRATRSPRWLTDLGYPEPAIESLRVDVTYVSRPYRRAGQDLGGRIGTIEPGRPGVLPYGGTVLAEEDDRCTLMIAGIAGARLESDDDSLLDVAQQLTTDVLTRMIRTGAPLGPAQLTRFPAERWYRYDRMERFPAGFLPLGDAFCSYNPVYGQGITVAALQALLLRDLLDQSVDDLSARFLTESSQIVGGQWQLATTNDRRFLQADQPGTGSGGASRVAILSDPVLAAAFLRVSQLIDQPSRLSEPDIVARIQAIAADSASRNAD